MSLIGNLIKGSPLDRWLFSDPPQFVLQLPTLFLRFTASINTDLSRTGTSNFHFYQTVSQPYWNLSKFIFTPLLYGSTFVYTQITHLVLSCLSFVYLQHCQPDSPVHGKGQLYWIPFRNSKGHVHLIPP